MRLFLGFISFLTFCFSQYTYTGIIVDADTQEPLIGVSIQIENRLIGTISDENGEYSIGTNEKHPKLILSYVGFISQTIEAKPFVKTRLKESALSSDVVMVYGEGYSPAQRIILNTIDRYQEQSKTLNHFSMHSYSKVFAMRKKSEKRLAEEDSLRRIGKEDEIKPLIPLISESYKKVEWKKPNKMKQTLLKRSQTRMFPAMFNILGNVAYENIFEPSYNSQPSPLSHTSFEDYNYHIQDTIKFQSDSVFLMQAIHKDTSNHWKYNLYIQKDRYLLKQVKGTFTSKHRETFLTIANVINFSGKHATLTQDYHLIENYTFPKNLFFSRLTEDRGEFRLSELYSDVRINQTDLETHFSSTVFHVDDDVDNHKKEDWTALRSEPLSSKEEKGYTDGDSLFQTLDPTQKFMFDKGLKIAFFDYRLFGQQLTDINDLYRFNPVEGHYLGLGMKHPEYYSVNATSRFGYSFGKKQFLADISARLPISYAYDISLRLHPYSKVQPLDKQNRYSPMKQTASSLILHQDEQNYVHHQGIIIDIQKQLTKYSHIKLHYKNETITPEANHTTFSFRKNGDEYPKNLAIPKSNEHEFGIAYAYKTSNIFRFGAVEIESFQDNGWELNADLSFNTTNARFKRFTLYALKEFKISREYEFSTVAEIYHQGKSSNVQNLYFPTLIQQTNKFLDFSSHRKHLRISGFNAYQLAAHDYYSLSGTLDINKDILFLDQERFYLSGGLFSGNQYKTPQISGIQMLDRSLHYEAGFSIMTGRIGIPAKISINYNSLTQKPFYGFELFVPFM